MALHFGVNIVPHRDEVTLLYLLNNGPARERSRHGGVGLGSDAAKRASIVAKAERSDAANRKQATGRTADSLPVHSFQTLLADLGTYCRIQATTTVNEKYLFTLHTRPTGVARR
jgi:hypothetical protein